MVLLFNLIQPLVQIPHHLRRNSIPCHFDDLFNREMLCHVEHPFAHLHARHDLSNHLRDELLALQVLQQGADLIFDREITLRELERLLALPAASM